MGRKTIEEMAGIELSLVYIAGNVSDADRAERVLSAHGVEYALSLEPFVTSSVLGQLLGRQHIGLFFSVAEARHAECRRWLEAEGLQDTVPLENSHDGA